MRVPRTLSCGLLAAISLALPGVAAADTAKPYIVVLERSSAPAARVATSDIARDQDVTTTQRYDDAVHGFAAKLDSHDVKAIENDPRVAEVVPDTPVKAMGSVPLAAGDNIPNGVRRVGAASGSDVRQASTANVAVVDTGVDLSHNDLNAVAGTNCVGSGAPQDDNGHGTHVAGIIGAKNQGSGAVGVAPGTRIYAVKVLNASGSGYVSQIVCGIDWVTSTRTDGDPNNDISVVNMSLGGGGSPTAGCGTSVGDVEHMAICRAVAAGVTFVVAAGNSHVDEQSFAPANEPEVLTVTSVSDSDGLPGGVGGRATCGFADGDDTAASYSNYATRAAEVAHTIAAPGTCIRSTYPGNMYATMSGTSMASPHVAGLVALCLGENGAHGPCWGKPPAQVVQMMVDAASTTAARSTAGVFAGGPARPIDGRYYGNMASTAFPSGAGAVPQLGTIPAVSGTAQSGATLTTTNGGWTGSGITYTYEWLRCATSAASSCAEIAGATGRTYVLQAADVGRNVRSRAVATNGDGGSLANSNPTATVVAPPPVAPAGTGAPALSGTAATGQTLTGDYGSWTGTAPMRYAAQWLRCTTSNVSSCAAISGATRLTYAVTNSDRGRQLRLMVTASNVKGSAVQRSAPTASAAGLDAPAIVSSIPINGAPVSGSVAGSIAAGSTLTAGSGTWSNGPTGYAYQWLRCPGAGTTGCVAISGATRTTLVAAAADRGRYVRVQVRATNAGGTGVSWSGAMRVV